MTKFEWKVYPDRIEFKNNTSCQKIPKKMIMRTKESKTMTEKRYYCDAPLEIRSYGIFDLSKVDKKIEDFVDEDGDIERWRFGNYLVDETESMMTGEEVTDILNELSEENERLKEKLEYETKLHNQYMKEALSMDRKLEKCKEKINELEKYEKEYDLLNKFLNENQSVKEIIEIKRKLNRYEQEEFERTQGRGW